MPTSDNCASRQCLLNMTLWTTHLPENRGIVSAPANVGLDVETASLRAERHQ
ncbi:hypothetical protein BIFBRE_04457 [Bifidobacterium breve DSM 20213 = JCM 1192]|uniref:Uncharacterized protein n=1 Tax=Bifidobacterium breve DSM 20213 = JCM 1192 TaxID=518634 RepID=D4BQT0_BIFBR|nr:hypothetical protein BIFBRE_04457 [Bifidobacterium breve DSM 20213 = JCM 1192]